MSGFGTQPYGTSQYGIGVPASPDMLPIGPSGFTRWIDPVTGDYATDSTTGHFEQTTALRQRVLIRLRTVLGSSTAFMLRGMKLPKKIGAGFAEQVQQAVRDCLRQETDIEKVMEILSITVETSGARSATHLRYKDLTTGATEDVRV